MKCFLLREQRMELILFYLFEEYFSNGKEVYETVLKEFLDLMILKLGPLDRLFTKFMVEIPEFNDLCLERVVEYCGTKERLQLGIASLRDFVIYRPSIRDLCVERLLDYAFSKGFFV